MSGYHINVFYSEEDGGYFVDIPDLKACSAFGSSAERALAEVREGEGSLARRRTRRGKAVSGAPLPACDLRAIGSRTNHRWACPNASQVTACAHGVPLLG